MTMMPLVPATAVMWRPVRLTTLKLLPAELSSTSPVPPNPVKDAVPPTMSKTPTAVPEAAQDRALTEATAFAIRIDVAEELARLRAHLDEIERLLGAGGEVGKRLDFLIQELLREANTLASKAASLELTNISVEMKVAIEQLREQVQNIE